MTSYNDVLDELQYYILNEENMKKSLEIKISCDAKEKQPRPSIVSLTKIQNKIFVPREKDTLFWCFYILKNGDAKYETMYNRNDIVARQMKIEYIDVIRKNKQTVKTYKFDSISNIENNLANEKSLNVKTFLTLCAIENLNILFINNKTYYELCMNDSEKVFIINCLKTKETVNYITRYGFEINTHNNAAIIKSTLHKVDNIDKPIKSISAYTVSELIEICNKLAIGIKNVKNDKNKSKKELYESIVQYF
jgi:hypothetical protein